MAEPRIREAQPGDVAAIRALLSQCRLPLDGVPEDLAVLLTASEGDRVIGVAGLELHEGEALLRSVATAPDVRGSRIASRLCLELERRATELGARRLHLLTETAELFFAKRGYRTIPREAAPEGVSKAREFSGICPASAVLMVRRL